MSVRWVRLSLVAASMAVLTGCVPGVDATPSTSPARTSASATPSTTPSADATTDSPQVLDDPGTWTLSAAGIGPLLVGADFDPATTGIGPYTRLSPECADAHVIRFDGDGLARLQVVLEEGGSRIDAVMVMSGPTGAEAPTTDSGITLDSDIAAVLAAYPDARQTREWPDGGTFAVADGSTWLAFGVDEGLVRSIAASTSSSPFREYCA